MYLQTGETVVGTTPQPCAHHNYSVGYSRILLPSLISAEAGELLGARDGYCRHISAHGHHVGNLASEEVDARLTAFLSF